ncbi:MAG TPA: hypothetical protein GXZ82_10830 [Firmicutes bacterium]|nr:hypothetical protein [Bacillota bacterium]
MDLLIARQNRVDNTAPSVYNRSKEKLIVAVLDTSFWSLACSIHLDAYLSDFYGTPIYVPPAVDAEIDSDSLRGPLIGPDRKRYRLTKQEGRLLCYSQTFEPYHEFGFGEREAIGLALSLDADLLINDHNPYMAAQALGITVVSVPEFIALVHKDRLINSEMALGMLGKISSHTAKPLIEAVNDLIAAT